MKKYILRNDPYTVNRVFVWHIVTPVAEMLFMGAPFAFEYYEIFEDGSSKWLKNLQEIHDAIANGNEIGVEGDWIHISLKELIMNASDFEINNCIKEREELTKKPFWDNVIDSEYNKKIIAKKVWDDIHNNNTLIYNDFDSYWKSF